VVSQAGAKHRATPEREIVRQIVEAGYQPKQRGSLYEIVNVPNVDVMLEPLPFEAPAEPLAL